MSEVQLVVFQFQFGFFSIVNNMKEKERGKEKGKERREEREEKGREEEGRGGGKEGEGTRGASEGAIPQVLGLGSLCLSQEARPECFTSTRRGGSQGFPSRREVSQQVSLGHMLLETLKNP